MTPLFKIGLRVQISDGDAVRHTSPLTDETFEKWWRDDGRMYDPDTDDVPWFDKRKELAELAFAKGVEIGMARSRGERQ